jgi:hypothetical protein
MEVELAMVTLWQIVERHAPELLPFLTRKELSMGIVLREGFDRLEPEDALEIVQHSICEQQKHKLLH